MSLYEEDWNNTTIETSLDETESVNVINDDSIDCFPSLDEEFIENDETDSTISDEVLINDLEKSNATVAAFTVVIIFCLFFLELVFTLLYMLSVNSVNFQGQIIAHGICKNSYGWEFIMNLTESWCDPKIFDREFRLEVQCPCFVPKMRSNNNIY